MKVERFATNDLAKEFAKTLEDKGISVKVFRHARGKRDAAPFVVVEDTGAE
ncbi:hypothetical protein [Pseudaminobacter sp. NGMCC 1.201702]|uniref:hypothetical protein n=1 Tax=Pseudaminobacter sp. NGMCC 1.201702 TaxID=3391825 RepID=UPI0039EF8C83